MDIKMKIMFLSDIHGNSGYLRQVMAQYQAENCERLILLGDLLYSGGSFWGGQDLEQQQAVADILNQYKQQIIAIRGNTDDFVDTRQLAFSIDREQYQFELDNHQFYLSHGHRYKNRIPDYVEAGAVYLQGHTHVPQIKKERGVWHLNPGSITSPRNGKPATYGIYDQGVFYLKQRDGQIYKQEQLF